MEEALCGDCKFCRETGVILDSWCEHWERDCNSTDEICDPEIFKPYEEENA